MEDLLDDVDKFTEKVIGSFVRIRISSAVQKQDMYRLVQVVGTSKVVEKYKTGRKTTDFILEILNLNKKEVITIDIVSNQDFTEEECKRLRQSIKCGLINRLIVGDIQEKAMVFQAVRVNVWLESEKQRIGHLRDRASETGRRKELRECVEKLQLLNSIEERNRRLNEVPKIHSYPKMDPDYLFYMNNPLHSYHE
ncbi:zinc finger CCCH domain-containing protein 19-like [Asparagus officinalis]|uniref:zinc finger CCCH domain-containing protein 19-like n=1 Tax=Asparagus officinalis TaxID=4686 RepID=UPI00098E4F7E|nr:zinc finger CCCH domain-containing protein 19-like [Asparagus officinalis]